MPTYEKRGKRWRAQLMRNGERVSRTFDTKAEAQAWAGEESAVRGGRTSRSLGQALTEYARKVSPTKRGEKWETVRIEQFRRTMKFVNRPIHEIEADDLSRWRDQRLKEVSPASVRRELNLLASIWETARLEWRWTTRNPVRDIRKPPASKPRTRAITEAEADVLTLALGYAGGKPETASQRVALAFLFALETAMRAGEIAGIRKQHIRGAVVHLPLTKNGSARDVPLSTQARQIIALCPDGFGVSAAQIDALFRKARNRAAKAYPAVAEIHFHDTRRTATTALSRKLEPMELARVTGHRDLKVLLSTYYAVTADELAKKLG